MKQDLDTVTNMLLNNEYKLHEDEKNIETNDKEISNMKNDNQYLKSIREKLENNNSYTQLKNNEKINNYENIQKKRSKSFDENGNFITKNSNDKENEIYIKRNRNQILSSNINENNENNENTKSKSRKKDKKKKTFKHRIRIFFRVIIILVISFAIFLYLFFKTPLFEKYRDIWVETAMSTMRHQYLAKWFLSDEEIQNILDKLEVKNDEDSNSNAISITTKKNDEITVEKITGKNYVGYVMTIPNASKVSLVDGRKSTRGSKLSEIVKEHNAIAGINAGGFADEGGVGSGNVLNNATILNKQLLKGNKNTKYSFIGLSADKKLVLGNYTYYEAMKAGVESAIQFGPFLIVNGKNQITNSSSGGIHPRAAIGQKKDGTFIFVVVDGRQPGYSLGTNLLELQSIFNKYDVYNAANLDGGSSATMYYDGKVVNKTSTPMGERYLPNAFIVSK